MKVKHMLLVGLFTSLMALMAQIQIRIPVSPVPITFQILGVCLASSFLGKKYGALSQIIYILIGLAGFPVFSGFNSGPGALLGPTGGYIISFPLSAYLIGFIIERNPGNLKNMRLLYFLSMMAGLIISYGLGTIHMAMVLDLPPKKALVMGVGWYFPLDMVKIFLASNLTPEIKKRINKSGLT